MTVKIKEMLELLDADNIPYSFRGNDEDYVSCFSSPNDIKRDSIIWVGNEGACKKIADLDNIRLAIVQEGIDAGFDNVVMTKESRRAFFTILNIFFPEDTKLPAVGEGTYIGKDVTIEEGVKIGHNCVIDGEITIGEGTVIHNNVTIINYARIGKDCEIQSGVRIGHDGFAYTEDSAGNKTMVKHHGGVVIGDRVYLGANSTIERGTLENTIIGEGTKIDQQCLIGHNSRIGRNNSFVTGSLLFGSVTTGENCYFASATVKDQTNIGDNAFIGIGSTVLNDVEENDVVVGTPARAIRKRFVETD